jgi:hypothetical protein
MANRAIILAILVAGALGACTNSTSPQAPAERYNVDAHIQRDLDAVVDATLQSNALMQAFAKYDPTVRDEFRQWARSAYERGGMNAVRTEMRQRSAKGFNRYVRRTVPRASDFAALSFGRAMHALMARLNADANFSCGGSDYAGLASRRAELEQPFLALVRATDQAAASAAASPQAIPAAELYNAEFHVINQRAATKLGLNPANLPDHNQATRREDRVALCRMFELIMQEVLAYRADSSGPMIRVLFAHVPE